MTSVCGSATSALIRIALVGVKIGMKMTSSSSCLDFSLMKCNKI